MRSTLERSSAGMRSSLHSSFTSMAIAFSEARKAPILGGGGDSRRKGSILKNSSPPPPILEAAGAASLTASSPPINRGRSAPFIRKAPARSPPALATATSSAAGFGSFRLSKLRESRLSKQPSTGRLSLASMPGSNPCLGRCPSRRGSDDNCSPAMAGMLEPNLLLLRLLLPLPPLLLLLLLSCCRCR
jgi:hypothetical protein